jgi:hypothetical protein
MMARLWQRDVLSKDAAHAHSPLADDLHRNLPAE